MSSPEKNPTPPPVDRFEFDLATPFFEQLRAFFDSLGSAPLDVENVRKLQPLNGVYGLIHDDKLVYVGKSDGTLGDRLTDHRTKILGRQNIDPKGVMFRAVYLAGTWVPLAPEANLIKYYQNKGLCEWNGNGFGPHDPGRNREETDKPPEGFDQKYPIRANYPTGIKAGDYEANNLLQEMKKALPFTFRYETDKPKGGWRSGSIKYNDKKVVVVADDMPADELLASVAKQLGPGWQATAFPSHLILYEEKRTYVYGKILWPCSQAD